MSDDLIKRMRSQEAVDGRPHEIEQLTDEAAALIEQQATRIAALEAKCALFAASLAQSEREVEERDVRIAALATVAPAVDAQPVAIYQVQTGDCWLDMTKEQFDNHSKSRPTRILYASAQSEGLRKDAERYRHLRQCNSGSLVIVQIIGTGEDDQVVLTEEHADEAIDAALSKQKAGERCDQR